jgi:hypothetical protein
MDGLAEHVERKRKPDERERHRRQRSSVRPFSGRRPGKQSEQDWEGVERKQRKRYRDQRDRGIQAETLHRDQQPDRQRTGERGSRRRHRHPREAHQREQEQRVKPERIATAAVTLAP